MSLPEQESHSHAPEMKMPSIRFKLEIEADWLERLDRLALKTGLRQDFAALFADLGVPAQAGVEIHKFSPVSDGTSGVLRLSVGQTVCHFPGSYLQRGLWLVTGDAGDASESGLAGEKILPHLKSLPPDQAVSLIRLVCPEIVKIRPSVLLSQPVVSAYRASLTAYFAESRALPETGALKRFLEPVLDLRISIGDRQTVARVLAQGLQTSQSPIEICEALVTELSPGVVEIQLAPESLPRVTLRAAEYENSPFAAKRETLFYEQGIHLPEMRFVACSDLSPGLFRIKINHLTAFPWKELGEDQLLVNDSPERLRLLGVTGSPAPSLFGGSAYSLIPASQESFAHDLGLIAWNPVDYLVEALASDLRLFLGCLVQQGWVSEQLSRLEESFPQIVSLVKSRYSPAILTQVYRLLAVEAISIRDQRSILQALIDFGYIVADDRQEIIFDSRLAARQVPSGDWLQDPATLSEFVRTHLKRYITHKYTLGQYSLLAYLVDPEIESFLANDGLLSAEEHWERLDRAGLEKILAAVRVERNGSAPTSTPLVVLTANSVRYTLRRLIAPEFPDLPVLSYAELAPEVNIQPVARISLFPEPLR
jgi:flagellar biosynthesis component FlhA